ncbi:hypothetical protein [Nocardioides sp.]|uniref:hypothetical protein n=1 Tax=Nocardioides sp. TaxID=35761 RepID=UPI00271EEC72|nr:hypothetical protein [Nocardioides sp.]MDO9455979.1 hypothetical protein [Nocardioides sp.]
MSDTSIDVVVNRLSGGCGPTGDVVDTLVKFEEDQVVVTLFVEPLPTDVAYACIVGGPAFATLRLEEPIGARMLVDGQCLDPTYADQPTCASGGVRLSR